jgi:chemotaxis protein histidine kinase CheA
LRGLLQGVAKAVDDGARVKVVQELYRRIHSLTGNAGMTGLLQIAQMGDALEASSRNSMKSQKPSTSPL